jgi:arsenate reductase-like glutaredoxin family protein
VPEGSESFIYHNPRCSTSRKTLDLLRDNGIEPTEHPILIERPFVVTPKGTRLARPIDAVREIL